MQSDFVTAARRRYERAFAKENLARASARAFIAAVEAGEIITSLGSAARVSAALAATIHTLAAQRETAMTRLIEAARAERIRRAA